MLAIAKTYLSLLEWKTKQLVKSIISPLEDDEALPKPPSANINTERKNSIPDIEDGIEQPVIQSQSSSQSTHTSKYQNPPSHHNSPVDAADAAGAIIKIAALLVLVIGCGAIMSLFGGMRP